MAEHLINYAKVTPSLVAAVCKTTANGTGTGVSVDGYDDVLMVWHQGVSLDTLSGSVYWTITFEESDTVGSGYTTIADADLMGSDGTITIDAAAEDPTLIVRQYIGSKKYVRMLATQTGTHTNGTPLAGDVILGRGRMRPVTQETELGTPS